MAEPEPGHGREPEISADIVHRYLLAHNLRAVGGNFDGRALYGLPYTMNGVGYERKDGTRVADV
ncbi:hypothetical protein [Frankia sp. AgW1.1]|uniref:hypothetical protein n=1 Tax=Frankia sp. AgW1.1 TaxID=1836971 RepID=UPI0019318853|nr:hypothetical protein [Frankia sp. AgW1.1]MBL7487116.1 hypothetical protein [Frankia sp. AgW1.1]